MPRPAKTRSRCRRAPVVARLHRDRHVGFGAQRPNLEFLKFQETASCQWKLRGRQDPRSIPLRQRCNDSLKQSLVIRVAILEPANHV